MKSVVEMGKQWQTLPPKLMEHSTKQLGNGEQLFKEI